MLSLELAAVQIIAVDTVQNSDFCIAGYLMNAGHFSKNNVSTGDLNRGRRACRLLETWSPCSHPFAILPVSAVSDAQKLATGNFLHVRAGSSEVLQTSNQLTAKAVSLEPLRGISRGVGAPPPTCTRKACTNTPRFACIGRLLRKHSRRLSRRLEVPFRELSTVWRA